MSMHRRATVTSPRMAKVRVDKRACPCVDTACMNPVDKTGGSKGTAQAAPSQADEGGQNAGTAFCTYVVNACFLPFCYRLLQAEGYAASQRDVTDSDDCKEVFRMAKEVMQRSAKETRQTSWRACVPRWSVPVRGSTAARSRWTP